MAAASNSGSVRIVPLLIVVCLVGIPAQAKYGAGSGLAASAETSTYVFVPDQSKVVQTGGIAGVHWTYSIKGQFQLTVDPNMGTASFAHVDANATDDSPFKHTLDLNRVFNMTSLSGTVEPSGSIKFTGKASDGSDVHITVTLTDNLAHLIGQTTPPPNIADFFIFSLDGVAQLGKYGGGSGTADDPYQIATAADLIALGETPEDYDKHFILTDDIDLDPNLPGRRVFDKAVIAPDADPAAWGFNGTPFTGVFDGNGHTISHLMIEGGGYLGLFGALGYHDRAGEVRDLGAVDVNISGAVGAVGGLVGRNDGLGAVTNCHSSGAVSGDEWGIGGLVGENRGSITASYSAGTVRGKSSVGGLVGWSGGTVAECYSTGVVSGGQAVGGLAGSNGGGTITNSYAAGSVVGDSGIGGLAGTNGYGCETHWQCALSVISDCYSGGTVKGTEDVGGLVGSSWDFAVVIRCFWDTQTSGQPASDGGTGKTTGEMQMAATFLEAGWDFVNVWGIGENQTYPYLRKYSAADINQDASVNFLDLAVLAENWLTGVNN